MVANFARPARHRVFKGGRGSGKTRGLALMSAVKVYQLDMEGREGVWLCSREHLNSLEESSLEEVKAAIRATPWLAPQFEIGEKFIRTRSRRISFAFAGLRHNVESIKSKARILGNWTDEAEPVPESSWQKLIPTIREEGSENWVSYNPESPESATHRRFVATESDDIVVTHINWRDNKWFPAVLDLERRNDLKFRADVYDHVWEGEFLTVTDAQVFKGKHEVRDFEAQDENGALLPGWSGPYYGVDFGFRPDPLAAVEVFVNEKERLIGFRREAYANGVEIDATVDFIKRHIPGIERYTIRADSAEPKTISYLQRSGFPKIEGVKKWPNSVEEGIRFMRGFTSIIHTDCPNTARDFRLYSHKVDRLTGDILPDLIDANNHAPDAGRYALAPIIKASSAGTMVIRL